MTIVLTPFARTRLLPREPRRNTICEARTREELPVLVRWFEGVEPSVAAWGRTAVAGAHHHLNMLGMRRAVRGRGLSRPLLEAVLPLADGNPASGGVDLTTESAANLPLYERFGFRVTASADVGRGFLTTWPLYRPRAG